MEIPRYWYRATAAAVGRDGRPLELAAWGWSSKGKPAAETKANERLAALSRRVEQGLELPRGYGYGERPVREEIVRELGDDAAVASAVVTRNTYGALVLNTRDAMFVDVDFPEPIQLGLLARLFGKKAESVESTSLDKLRAALDGMPGSYRIYRTAAGWRVLATDRRHDPKSIESRRLMKRMGVDPAYLQLCGVQKSFRARLTPKPWRCNMPVPPNKYPRDETEDQTKFSSWLGDYDQACEASATCRFIAAVGPNQVDDDLRAILELHDSATRATSELPLA